MMYNTLRADVGIVQPMPLVRWKLKEYLEDNDLSAYSVAKEIGVSLQSIYRITNNQAKSANFETTANLINALCKMTGKTVSFDDILEYDPEN